MQVVIESAIRNGTLLSFHYDKKLCVVEPYALGLIDKELCLRAWQTNGGSAGWREFQLSGMQHLNQLEGVFSRYRQCEITHPDWAPVYTVSVGAHRGTSA